MTKILVVPDIHLKTKDMLKRAEEIIRAHAIDQVVFLGDYFDDWNQLENKKLYLDTIRDLKNFAQIHPSTFILGNHDIPYLTRDYHHYSTPIPEIREACGRFLRDIKPVLAVELKTASTPILLSHAGFCQEPTPMWFQDMTKTQESIRQLEAFDHFTNSCIWVRPDILEERENASYERQIVGHTPVWNIQVIETKNNHDIICLDTWSTTQNGQTIGPKKMAIIDSEAIHPIFV